MQDSLLLEYNYNLDKRKQIEQFLTNIYKEQNDLEAIAFLEVLKIGIGIDQRSFEELEKFVNEVGVKYREFPNVQARAYRTIGYHYFIGLNNYEKAFDVYLKLEKLLRLYDDKVITDYADYCGEIVTAFYKFKDYKSAIKIGEIGLVNASNKWYIYNTLGLCYIELHQLDTAKNYFQQAVTEAKLNKMAPIYQTIALGNIGYIYYLRKDYEKAKPLFKVDLKEALKNEDFGLAAGSSIPLSDVLIKERAYAQASKLLDETRTYIAKSGQVERLEKFFPVKSRYYQALGDYSKALAFRDSTIKAIVRNDSIFNGLLVMRAQQRTDLERIADEATKLENYKRITETRIFALIALFIIAVVFYLVVRRYRNRIKADKKKIEELNRIMELRQGLSADMHDDIGSTLSSISLYTHSLLMKSADEDNRAVLEKIKANAQNIQENISDIIWSVNPKMDSMEQVVARMRAFGADITEYAGIKFEFDTDAKIIALPLTMEVRKNLYLIYKEAINNAVKYSNCKQINISLKSNREGCFEMDIVDNGNGFELDKAHDGNGIANMRHRAKAIGATLHISTETQRGTRIRLVLSS
ncbi:ATP-binding protein [Pedobacter sp. UBA4863]|uniref:tetratricopeptide repeat-containing sensor histidine kinase n=1 Tax=Pedobacter sp. UBA4863 TaxID=1947060 RepID=UPI0025E5F023|nr:ATP-binding protein [Pedobacter sp. UBA4863]